MNRQWQHHSRGNRFCSHSSVGKQVNTSVLACLPTKNDNIFRRTSKERETFFLHIWKLKNLTIVQLRLYYNTSIILQYALVNIYVDTCTKHQCFTKLVTNMYKIYKDVKPLPSPCNPSKNLPALSGSCRVWLLGSFT